MPLQNHDAISFLATAKADDARAFFEDIIGLKFVEETDYALVFSVGKSQLRIQKMPELSPVPYTSMGWQVDDIEAIVAQLRDRGVVFKRFDELTQDADGIWTSPSGGQIAWFHDPDGNTLSLTQQ